MDIGEKQRVIIIEPLVVPEELRQESEEPVPPTPPPRKTEAATLQQPVEEPQGDHAGAQHPHQRPGAPAHQPSDS